MKKRHRKKSQSIPPVYHPDDPLLKADEAAVETGRAISTFWRDVRNGDLPPPYYVMPKMPRWRRSDLRSAIDASPRVPIRASVRAHIGRSDK